MNGFKRGISLLPLLALVLTSCAPKGSNTKSTQFDSAGKGECAPVQAQALPSVLGYGEQYDSYIVKLKDRHIRPAGAGSPIQVAGIETEDLRDELVRVDLKFSPNKAEALAQLAENPNVEYIEPDYPIYLESFSSNDPLASKQWAHKKVYSSQAWGISPGSRDVVVAVIDSGVDYTHKDLSANMWRNPGEVINGRDDDGNGYVDDIYGWDFVKNDADPRPDSPQSSHGTHVAGTVGAVGGNQTGIVGHSPYVKIMALRFIGDDGGRTSDAIKSINYAVDMGADILNNSWGSSNYSRSVYEAILRAEQKGILFVAAAGNAGMNIDARPWYPSSYPHKNILNVAASTASDRRASWSNYGARTVHVAAPGAEILSTITQGSYGYKSGTSMAAPLAAGVAATLLAIRPDLTASQLIQVLSSTTDKLSSLEGKVITSGRINAYRAASAVKNLGTGDTPPQIEDSPADLPPANGLPTCPDLP